MDCFHILVIASHGPCGRRFFELLKKNGGIFYFEHFSFSLTWDSMGAKIKNITPPSNHFWFFFKLFLKFLLTGPHKTTVLDFWNFEFTIFHDFFFVFVNMGPYWSQNFKTPLLPQNNFESFEAFPEFPSRWALQKYCFHGDWMFGIWVSYFNEFFTFTIVPYRETQNLSYLQNERP